MKLACTFLFVSSLTLSAATVLNSGFETPVIGPTFALTVNNGANTITGWNVTGTSVDIVSTIGGDPTWAHSGAQAIDLAGTPGPGGVNQDIVTIPGQNYMISFWVSSNGSAITNGLSVNWDGNTLPLYSSPAQGTWTNLYFNAAATTALTNLSFFSSLTGNAGPLLDDVSLSAVPEPGTIGLVAGGLLLAFVRLRRR